MAAPILGDVLFRAAQASGPSPDVPRLESLASRTLESFLATTPNASATVGFFRIVAGVPEMKLRTFRAVDGRLVDPTRIDCPGDPTCGRGRGILRFAYGDDHAAAAIDRMVTSAPDYWRDASSRPGGIPAAVERLMRAAIDAAPDACGYPITMVRIHADGIEWIARGECRDERQPLLPTMGETPTG